VEGKRSSLVRKNLDREMENIPSMPLPLVMGNPKEVEDKENK